MSKRFLAVWGASLVLVLFIAWCNAVPVAADPPGYSASTNTPRPTLTPTTAPIRVPRLYGTIFDWGNGYMPAGVKVTLAGDGWEISTETDKDGRYEFKEIGNEVARLNVVVPDNRPELASLTHDLPVKTEVGQSLVVNMALHPKSVTPDAIVSIAMVASAPKVEQGDRASFTITVNNHWEKGLSGVIVAGSLPAGLTCVGAAASQGSATCENGLLWADLSGMAAGAMVTVTLDAQVDTGPTIDEVIINKAAVYYQENVAVQAEAQIQVIQVAQPAASTDGSEQPSTLPVTGGASVLPVIGVLLAGALFGIRKLRHTIG